MTQTTLFATTPRDIYRACDQITQRLRDRYRARIVNADPRIGLDCALSGVVQNWGNADAKALQRRLERVQRRLVNRRDALVMPLLLAAR